MKELVSIHFTRHELPFFNLILRTKCIKKIFHLNKNHNERRGFFQDDTKQIRREYSDTFYRCFLSRCQYDRLKKKKKKYGVIKKEKEKRNKTHVK